MRYAIMLANKVRHLQIKSLFSGTLQAKPIQGFRMTESHWFEAIKWAAKISLSIIHMALRRFLWLTSDYGRSPQRHKAHGGLTEASIILFIH
jgi:hypothetical protein